MKTTALAHHYWKESLHPEAIVIDATCGNGQDTLVLAQLLKGSGKVFGYDIQQEALEKTAALLKAQLSPPEWEIVILHHSSHAHFKESSANLIVYNLGYLPKGNKAVTTQVDTTLQSLAHACEILTEGGLISVMTYSGHVEGAKEEAAVLEFSKNLASSRWSVLHHRWLNRKQAPSLLLMWKGAGPS